MDKIKTPPVSDEELSAWEQSSGEYLNRYAAKRLMFTVRDLRAKLTAAQRERDANHDSFINALGSSQNQSAEWNKREAKLFVDKDKLSDKLASCEAEIRTLRGQLENTAELLEYADESKQMRLVWIHSSRALDSIMYCTDLENGVRATLPEAQ